MATAVLLIALLRRSKQRARWLLWAEVALIVLWTIWVGRDLLNFDRTLTPTGREFGMSIQWWLARVMGLSFVPRLRVCVSGGGSDRLA